MISGAGLRIYYKTVHQLNVILIIQVDTPAVLLVDGAEINQVIVHVAVVLITELKAAMITTSSMIQKGVPQLVGMKIGFGIVTT